MVQDGPGKRDGAGGALDWLVGEIQYPFGYKLLAERDVGLFVMINKISACGAAWAVESPS
jgi:hypothetical protein